MEENPPVHPGVPEEVYHTLGKKTLWIFVLERVHASVVLLLVSLALFVASQQPALAHTQFGDLTRYALAGGELCLILFIVIFGLTFFFSWLSYINFKFALAENSLKIKRGILNKEEVAIPYRQIQDVDIKRDFAFLLMGLSRIVILTAGHEDPEDSKEENDDESEGILPALDKDLAEWLQQQLLSRANIQKIVEEPANTVAPPGVSDNPPK